MFHRMYKYSYGEISKQSVRWEEECHVSQAMEFSFQDMSSYTKFLMNSLNTLYKK